MTEFLRSKKYQLYSNNKILRLRLDKPDGEALHFLQIEIEARGLQAELERRIPQNKNQIKHTPWYYLLYLFMFGLAASRFFSKMGS
jgi:hypothetical protein